jgi:hypothetical protein
MIPISYLNGHVYLHIFCEVILGDLMIIHGDLTSDMLGFKP